MKILDLTTDSVVAKNGMSVTVTHLPCGRSVLPSGRTDPGKHSSAFSVIFSLMRARIGYYDWLFLPPIHASWQVANSGPKKLVKNLFRKISNVPWICRLFRWICFGHTKIVLVDNSDQLWPSVEAVAIFNPVYYLMANAPRSLVGQALPYGLGKTELRRIAMMMDDLAIEKFSQARSNQDRPYDIFITGTFHHPLRQNQLQALAILQKRGRSTFELKERGFDKFSDALSKSKCSFAGQGLGYYSIRMSEVCAAGSVPIVNEPKDDIDHPYVNGLNAITYPADASPEEIADVVESALDHPSLMDTVRQHSWEMMMNHNRLSRLSDKVIDLLINSH